MVKCNICNREIDKNHTTYFLSENLLLCESCAPQLHTCRGCANREYCAVENNVQNIPPTIVNNIQKDGRIVQQIEMVNPELFKTYCPTCNCSTNDTQCGRKITQYCDNWELHNDYKFKE